MNQVKVWVTGTDGSNLKRGTRDIWSIYLTGYTVYGTPIKSSRKGTCCHHPHGHVCLRLPVVEACVTERRASAWCPRPRHRPRVENRNLPSVTKTINRFTAQSIKKISETGPKRPPKKHTNANNFGPERGDVLGEPGGGQEPKGSVLHLVTTSFRLMTAR